MGRIKKLLDRELVGGTTNEEIYPISSTKAIYDENNQTVDYLLKLYLDKLNKLFARQGYYVCDSISTEPDKEIQVNNFELSTTIRLLVRMSKANLATGVSFEVNTTGAYPLYYNGAPASPENTWEADEVLDIYFDGNFFQAFRSKGSDTGALWELRVDEEGNDYLYTDKNVVIAKGLITYSSIAPIVPSIFEGIPFDNKTIWLNPETGVVEVIGGTGEGGLDTKKLWEILGTEGIEQIHESHIADILSKYSTTEKMWELLLANTEEQINISHLKKALSEFSSSEEFTGKYVTVDSKEQTIQGIKTFLNGLKIGEHLINVVDGVLYLDCSIAVTGGITAYAMGNRTPSTIMDGIVVDDTTISKEGGILHIKNGAGGGSGFDESKLWELLEAEGIQQIDKSHLTTALNGYATTEQLNKKWTQDDVKISHWDEAYSWGNHADAGYITTSAANSTYVKKAGDTMTGTLSLPKINGGGSSLTIGNDNNNSYVIFQEDIKQKDSKWSISNNGNAEFIDIKIGSSKIKIYESGGVAYIDGDLAVTGGVTAYAQGNRSISTITDGVNIDNVTIKRNSSGQLYVDGDLTGGASSWDDITGKPIWITDDKPTYKWTEIQNKPTTLSGYGITDAYKIISGTPDTNKGMSAGYWDGIGSYASFVGNNWGGQFKMDSTEVLSYRTVKNGVVGSWKTIAFTTSTVDNADKLDNFHETDFFRKDRFKLSTVNSTLYSLNGTAIDTSNPNYTGLYVGFNANASNSTILLHLETGNSPKLKYNYAIDSNKLGSSWREFAFIDSNVASATKLQTSRNIWGKSFDGTANVNGRWELDGNNGGKLSIFDSGTYRSIQSYGGALCINVEGNNVGIGTSTAAYKLTVKGECSVSDKIITNNFFECAKNNGVILSKTGHTNTKLISWVWEGGYGDSVIFDIPGNSTLSRRMRLCSDTGLIITGNLIVEGNILSRGGVTAYASGSGSDEADQFSVKKLNVVGTNNSNSYISADSTSNMYFNWGGKTGLVLSGTSIRSGNAYPNQFDLGSSQTPFKDLYLKGLTINSSPSLSDSNMTAIRTDINNAYFGLRHNGTNWYVQGWQGQLMMGPGGTKSIKIDVNGNMSVYGKVTESSDKRLKSDIKPLANRGYIEPKTFVKDGIKYIGFIAQDVQKLYPELVVEDNTEEHYLSLSYSQYVAVLQAQIIELNERIKKLEQLNN